MSSQNSAGRTLFILAVSAAIIALVLSVSRLFLSSSDRSETFFFAYNLAYTSQMTAFLAVVLLSIPLILIGGLLSKEYDIIGTPMLVSGVISLIFITIAAYSVQSFARYQTGGNVALGEAVLTAVIALEWLMLLIYTWRSDLQSETTGPTQPSSNQPTQNTPPQNPPVNPTSSNDDFEV